MKHLLPLLLILGLFTGCSTSSTQLTPEQQHDRNVRRVESAAKLAVAATVTLELRKHPETRAAFQRAQGGLDTLISEQRWDVQTIAAVILASGVEKFSGPDGQLIVAGTMLVLNLIDTGDLDLSQQDFAKAVALGASEGLKIALPVIKL